MKKSKGNQKVTKRDGRVNSTFKAVTIGPIVTMAIFVAIYLVWWGVSKVFYSLHGLLTESVFPWIAENWLVSIVIWVFLAITASIFAMLFGKEKNVRSGEKNVRRTAPVVNETDEDELEEVKAIEVDPNTSDVYFSRP